MSEPRETARQRRVDDGVEELARWLRDQVAQGLAAAERAPSSLWDEAARRLVDAQAPALAGRVRALASVPRGGERWPARLLEEYGLLHLLTRAHQRRSGLPEPLRATIRSRVGFTVPKDQVLAGVRVRDRWYVAARHDEEEDGLAVRRVWLRGLSTGRPALVLSYAAGGRPLEDSLTVGTALDADLAFYPGAQPLRALVAERHSPAEPAVPPGTTIAVLLEEYATALSHDPWLDRWPALLSDVRLARAEGSLHLTDPSGAALPLTTSDPWRLLAVSGGAPLTIAAEWTPTGLTPLTAHHPDEGHVPLT